MNKLTVIVIGASGDLARRKIYPSLFSLYCRGYLPDDVQVVGYARTSFESNVFRNAIMEKLTCRYTPDHSCQEKMDAFLAQCSYHQGQYNRPENFILLKESLSSIADDKPMDILVYFAVPPFVFAETARSFGTADFSSLTTDQGWIRTVMEKPFGSDRETFDKLVDELDPYFTEQQMYRIDHYLGKEVIQNLMVLRFGNLIFEPIWNRNYVERVEISWSETLGVEGRGGYFDQYGIIRDVMQNHLLQIVALIGMESPLAVPQTVRNEKVKLLQAVQPVTLDDCVLGQYVAGEVDGQLHEGYREDKTVPVDSRTVTYAECLLKINNYRWDGVPFVLRAGKACETSMTKIHVKFKPVPADPFENMGHHLRANELVIEVQPNEQIILRVQNKKPGLSWEIVQSELNMSYQASFDEVIPDAYESLLVDVLRGQRTLFLRKDELEAAWDIFSPLLHEIDEKNVEPEAYAFGTPGVPKRF